MTRKALNATQAENAELTIEERVKHCYDLNEKSKTVKDELEKEKTFIKNYFVDNELPNLVVGNIKCSVSTTQKNSFNTEKCLAIMQNLLNSNVITEQMYNSIVKTKPYIDEDALENALYNNFIIPEHFDSCIDTTNVTTLRFSKHK